MGLCRKIKCRHCRTLFYPDARNAKRQKYCSKPECRNASKRSSQRRWLEKPDNRDYFRGAEHLARVRRWRKAHPGYWRRKTKIEPDALQDPLKSQPTETNSDNPILAESALQDLLRAQPHVFIGLIAKLTGSALQDDIAMALRQMQQLGADIINPNAAGGRHGEKASHLLPTHP